MSVSYVFKP